MSRENMEVVRRINETFNARDTGECEWWPALIGGGLIEGVVYCGHHGIVQFMAVQAMPGTPSEPNR
jgi:hypothetical protein